MPSRRCSRCAAPVPWGVPQCPACGAWTVWRRWQAAFGLVVGAGTALAVLAVIVRVFVLPPPAGIARDLAVARFRAAATAGELRGLVHEAAPCGAAPAVLCVEVSQAFTDLPAARRAEVHAQLSRLWAAAAGDSGARLTLFDSGGVPVDQPSPVGDAEGVTRDS